MRYCTRGPAFQHQELSSDSEAGGEEWAQVHCFFVFKKEKVVVYLSWGRAVFRSLCVSSVMSPMQVIGDLVQPVQVLHDLAISQHQPELL